jgi:hypothetical protein
VPGALEAAATAVGLVSDISSFAKSSRENKRRARSIIEALRMIYFTPRGTLELLKILAAGQMPDPDDIQDVLVDFNDAEWRVARSVRAMEFDASDSYDMSLRHRRELDGLAYGKRILRRHIQDALNHSLSDGQQIDTAQATELVGRVEELNALIERIEEELL